METLKLRWMISGGNPSVVVVDFEVYPMLRQKPESEKLDYQLTRWKFDVIPPAIQVIEA